MVYYNLTFLENTTSLMGVMTGVNDATSGSFITILLIVLWALMFIVFKNYEIKSLFLGTSFLMVLVFGLFFGAGLVSAWALTIPAISLLIALILKLWGDS